MSTLLFSRFGELPGTASWTQIPRPVWLGQPGSVQLVRSARRRSRITWIEKTRNPPSVSRGGLRLARPVSLPTGRIPFREPPCPGRQVGEGVSPTLDAVEKLAWIDQCVESKSQDRATLELNG